ncbi:MAG: DNRLRE domain-containing protein, partial [Clostridia bacterium]|nr:DNRLRE domain-containing protein [Clostridia bacterium]
MKKFIKTISVFLSLLLILQAIPLNASALESLLQAESTQISKETSTEPAVNEPYILSEDISKREENVKHFKMSDGTYQAAVYAEPVHYYEGGQWIEYDNTIKLNSNETKGKEKYTANISGTEFTFPDNINAVDKVKIKKNGHEISFGYKKDDSAIISSSQILTSSEKKISDISGYKAAAESKHAVRNGALKYNNVSESTDIEYELSSTMLKESIIVSGRQNEYVYNFSMDIGELTPVTNSNGSISLIDGNNGDSLEYVIVAPFMTDAKGLFSNQVTMSLSVSGSEYILTVTADKDWLNTPEREFPVVIDPTLFFDPERVNEIFDTYVDSGAPNASNPEEIYSIIGYNVLGTGRAYLKFNFPDLPHCGVITNVQLALVQLGYDPGNGVTNHMVVYESPSPQNYQTLTWNNQPSLASQPIVDYTVFRSGDSGSVSYILDITKIAKKWFEEGVNNGLFLASANENSTWRSTIYTSNYTANNAYPKILISYIDNKGLEDYWSYETIDMGRSGTAYVNQYNGLLTYVHTDINLGGNVTYLSAAHIYSNDYKESKPYGYGFRLSAQESVTVLEQNDELYDDGYRAYLTDADGTAHYFKHRTDNEWYFEFDTNLILKTVSGASYTYELQYEDGSKRQYDSDGKLLSIVNKNGNNIIHRYDEEGRISYISDYLGRKVHFTYTDGYLTSMSDAMGRVTTYTYRNGNLTLITYPDGKETRLSYISNRLFCIVQTNLNRVAFMYKSSNRVNYIEMQGTTGTVLRRMNFYFNGSNTFITDSSDSELTVGFDNMGRAVSYTDKDGKISTTKYNTGGNMNNTVAESSDTFAFSDNLLSNHSFENEFSNWIAYSNTGNDSYSLSSSQSYIGSTALKFTRWSSGIILFLQDIYNVTAGKEYTFSAYIKATAMDGGSAGLCIEAKSGNSTIDAIRSSTVTTVTDGWIRVQTTLTCPSGTTYMRPYVYIEGTSGTVYFDALQFEEASSAGHYNLLENPGFEKYSSSSFTGWSTPAAAYPVANGISNTQSAAITGSIAHDIRLAQGVALGASTKERTLIFGGTAKG